MAAASSCTGVTIAVRGKSVGKHDRRDAQRTQDQLRKNTNAALGNIRKRDLFPGAGFQTCIGRLPLRIATLSGCMANLGGQFPLWVKSRHSAISEQCPLYPQTRTFTKRVEMSALCQKADIQEFATCIRLNPDHGTADCWLYNAAHGIRRNRVS